jgi:dsDNA-specific endonuclease/ATPase MutS2
MKFAIGDIVETLDDDVVGTVMKIDANDITIETTEGFLLQFAARELMPKAGEIKVSNAQVASIKKHKEIPKKPSSVKIRPKDHQMAAMEVDLHLHQLTNDAKGLDAHDKLSLQLDTAKRQLEFAIQKRIARVVFIHGVGEGVLKLELQYLFKRYENIKFYEADYKKYGLGATEVFIEQRAMR